MYIGEYAHGTLRIVKQSRLRCQEEYVRVVQGYLTSGLYTVVSVVPRYTMFVCYAREHIARYKAQGIPCIAVSHQGEYPEIPHGWPNG